MLSDGLRGELEPLVEACRPKGRTTPRIDAAHAVEAGRRRVMAPERGPRARRDPGQVLVAPLATACRPVRERTDSHDARTRSPQRAVTAPAWGWPDRA